MYSTPAKRKRNDENEPPFSFINQSGPQTTRKRRPNATILKEITPEARQAAQETWAAAQKNRDQAEAKHLETAQLKAREEDAEHLQNVLNCLKQEGYGTLYGFFEKLFTTKDRKHSSHVSRLLVNHGTDLYHLMNNRQPGVFDEPFEAQMRERVGKEIQALVNFLRPEDRSISASLTDFSLSEVLEHAKKVAPTLLEALTASVGGLGDEELGAGRKKKDVIICTVLCILAKTNNERASEFQLLMCIYLLACGASRSLFDVLNHAGFSMSYSSAMDKIKALGQERLKKMCKLVRTHTCMVIWDNINMAFRVAQQREHSKDHFDNGTTATLIPCYNIPFGSLPLSVLPPRKKRRITYEFNGLDLLPSATQVLELQEAMRWHIANILLEQFPDLKARLKLENFKPRDVLAIPVHKTEQYPLPAALIDESTIDGTLDVIDHIFFRTLKLNEDEIRRHGPFFAAGDQLTNSLIDSVSASRRDDTVLADNPSKFLKPQIGLFHAKIAGSRCIANEHWGVANSKAPWSLWRMNALLGRKSITAGWKSKQLPPFRPILELMLPLVLVANILDAFRVLCPGGNIEKWVSEISCVDEIWNVTQSVLGELCSARRVEELRQLKMRDVPLENIILFNRDALILLVLQAAIKRGDIGTVVNVLAHWMLMFRGSGKMPKYADAVFVTVMDLKNMDTSLRQAYLMNWLANLSGRFNGFKEMDLLQEHQNFWLKIIYAAKGSNRSWDWFAMISVSVFALRDVIRQVQTNFQTPYNGKSHTSPSATADIAAVQKFLKEHEIQTFTPTRLHNEFSTPARDLFAEGAAYANAANPFRNFREDKRKVTFVKKDNHNSSEELSEEESDKEDEEGCGDFGDELGLDVGDLAMDIEEFPPEMEPEQFVGFIRDAIEQLS